MGSEISDQELMAMIEANFDDNEKALLIYTLQVIAKLKSKSAKTRRWADFENWVRDNRTEKVTP